MSLNGAFWLLDGPFFCPSRAISPNTLMAWRTFPIFFIFFLLGEGEGGSPRPPGGGGRFSIENPRRGGGSPGGAEGPGGGLRRIGDLGGGVNIFFSGPKCPPRWAVLPKIALKTAQYEKAH